MEIGTLKGSTGSLIVDGLGSSIIGEAIPNGLSISINHGSLTITNGATINAFNTILTRTSGRYAVKVDGAGSTLTLSQASGAGANALSVGVKGVASISDGGLVSATSSAGVGIKNGGILTTDVGMGKLFQCWFGRTLQRRDRTHGGGR